MKVLIFSTAYLPFVGGAEIAIKEITDRIENVQFDLITLRFDRRLPKFERLGNINVYRLGFVKANPNMADLAAWPLKLNKLLFPFAACLKAGQLNRKSHYDLIWSMMAAYAGFAAMFFKTFNPGMPYLLTLQEGDPIDYIKKKVRLAYPLFKKIFVKADYIQAISHYLADWARGMGFKGEVAVVPNGVEVGKFQIPNSLASRAPAKQDNFPQNPKFKIPNFEPGDKILFTASRLVKKNAVGDIIKALKYLPETVKLLIVGDGPDRRQLEKSAKDPGLPSRVFFAGQINNDDLPRYLAAADIFIRPSLSEGQGIAFLEAMAAGLPVIATPVGGIVDFLRDGETGLFCRVSDPESIAEQVKTLLSDEILAEKLKASSLAMVKRDYGWEEIAEKMENIFKAVKNKL